MSLNLWLSQPETERKLGAGLRVAAAIALLWALAAAYGLWSARAALAAAQSAVLTQSKQISQIAEGIPEKRRLAGKAAGIRLLSGRGAGSAEITGELAGLAQAAGAEVRGVRIGDGGQAKAGGQTGSAGAPSAGTPATGQTAASTSDNWNQETFECNITGEYGALTRFLSELAASPYVLGITAIQVTQADAKTHPDAPRLEMKLSGTVYEVPAKS